MKLKNLGDLVVFDTFPLLYEVCFIAIVFSIGYKIPVFSLSQSKKLLLHIYCIWRSSHFHINYQ